MKGIRMIRMNEVGLAAAVVLVLLTSSAVAQDRLPPIPADKMTGAQKEAAAQFKTNRGQDVFGPFVPLLRSPDVMLRTMALGDYLRYQTVLGNQLNEFVILITARHYTQHYEWSVHYPIAVQGGLNAGIAKAIAEGRRPAGMSADQEIAYDFTWELLHNHGVSDPTYARAVARFGEQGTIEMVGVAAYYTYQSMVLNTARTPVTTPPAVTLKPLR
jgi:4-carboxymuconolactone decarboxylase